MAVCILDILSATVTGITGILMLSLAHRFVSPAIYIL
jgi:hypothetical protein